MMQANFQIINQVGDLPVRARKKGRKSYDFTSRCGHHVSNGSLMWQKRLSDSLEEIIGNKEGST
jgi:hypothetical protein